METGEIEEYSEALVSVEIEWVEKSWIAFVDLSQGKLVRLVEKLPRSMQSGSGDDWDIEYFHIEEGPVEEKVKP